MPGTVPNRAGHTPEGAARVQGDHETPTAERVRETNSAGGSKWQKPASQEAESIGKSWMNTPAHRYAHEAVVYTQSGQRMSGPFVSPARHPETGEAGIHLHRMNGAPSFHKDTDVHEVHFVEKPGMPGSSEREDSYRKEQAARNQKVE
jgi:hypothetical protein